MALWLMQIMDCGSEVAATAGADSFGADTARQPTGELIFSGGGGVW